MDRCKAIWQFVIMEIAPVELAMGTKVGRRVQVAHNNSSGVTQSLMSP